MSETENGAGRRRTIRNGVVIVGVFLLALFFSDPLKTAFNNVFQPEKVYEPAFEWLKEVVVSGSEEFVVPSVKLDKLDFQEGTLALCVRKETVLEGIPIALEVVAKDGTAGVLFEKDEENRIRFSYRNNRVGTIVREAVVSDSDVTTSYERDDPNTVAFEGFFVAFEWSMKTPETILYLNGRRVSSD